MSETERPGVPGDEEHEASEQVRPGPEEEGPDAADLDDDPAYNPDDEDLKGIKGG
jgi:hypothetical protein